VNAARNLLAEGLSVAACGGGARPGETPAAADEAATALGVPCQVSGALDGARSGGDTDQG
jgi:hypothetical protein